MKKLSRIAAAILLAGIVITTSGCYVVPVYHEVGLHVSHGDGYGYQHHQHYHRAPACPPHGW